jgi:hypothetical protein
LEGDDTDLKEKQGMTRTLFLALEHREKLADYQAKTDRPGVPGLLLCLRFLFCYITTRLIIWDDNEI